MDISELRLVSFVIETVNEATEPDIDLGRVLGGIQRQTWPSDKLEILVVVDEQTPALLARIERDFPQVRTVVVRDSNYFSMKREGSYAAKGEIIALLDSDCDPSPVWVERAVARICSGADAVAGKTRYPDGAQFGRTFSFFNFGYIQKQSDGQATGFLPNNAAFRAEVLREHNFDPRIRRGGAGHLLGTKLKALGYRLEYEPEMLAYHNMYGVGEEMQMRVKAGFDAINLSRIDTDSVIDETRILKQQSVLGLFRVFIRRLLFDIRTVLTNRRDLDIRFWQIPWFLAVSPLIRFVEFVSAVITLVRPDYFKRKFGW
jgi:glycosyltransferase involved in cell wall biosynthesis